ELRRLDRRRERGCRIWSSQGTLDAGALDRVAGHLDHRPAHRPARVEDRSDRPVRSGDDGTVAGATGPPVLGAVSRDGCTAPGGIPRDASSERSRASGDRRRGARYHGRDRRWHARRPVVSHRVSPAPAPRTYLATPRPRVGWRVGRATSSPAVATARPPCHPVATETQVATRGAPLRVATGYRRRRFAPSPAWPRRGSRSVVVTMRRGRRRLPER